MHDGLIPSNPCHIRGAGNSKRVHKTKPLTLPELEQLVSHMPDHLKLWSWQLLGADSASENSPNCAADIDMNNGRIKVRRAVVHVNGKAIVGTPRSDAGIAMWRYRRTCYPQLKRTLPNMPSLGGMVSCFTLRTVAT